MSTAGEDAVFDGAGYAPSTLDAITEALFPWYEPGYVLLDQHHAQLIEAVDVLHWAQLDEPTLLAALEVSKQSSIGAGRPWRCVFWSEALRRAANNSASDRLPHWITHASQVRAAARVHSHQFANDAVTPSLAP